MKRERIICLLIVIVMCVGEFFSFPAFASQSLPSSTQGVMSTQTQPTEMQLTELSVEDQINSLDLPDLWKQELLYALELGMPMEKVQQTTISGMEMAEILDHYVEYADSDKLVEWKALLPKLRTYEEALTRFDVMGALFLAAQTVGGDWIEFKEDFTGIINRLQFPWDDSYFTEGLFDKYDTPLYTLPGQSDNFYLDYACLHFNLSRKSSISGEAPIAYDFEANSIHEYNLPTYAEGVLAVVRLILSTEPYVYVPTEIDAVYLDAADTRREEIRTATTELSNEVTGTVYYISNNGSDDNDGCSPESAWATPYRAMTAKLQYGDAVLFERGGTWHIDVETNLGDISRNHGYADGVHVGAYGDGEKPVLRGDIERANEAAFWELYYEKNGVKIWKASEALRDSAVIVFNEGETYAKEVFPWLNNAMEYVNPDGTAFVVENALDKNLTFCNLLHFEEGIESVCNRIDSYARGELYLRCDEGNPAEVYETVSIPQEPVGIDMFPNSSIRDICILYCTMMGTQGTDIGTTPENYQFINLEIGWCGGWLQNYILQEIDGVSSGYKPHIGGGGIGVYQTELQVTDSYIHHCGPMAMIESIHDHIPDDGKIVHHENQRFSGNLYEYCGAPMHWADLSFMEVPGSAGLISNLVFEDNMVMNSGDGWVYNSVLQSDGENSLWLSAVENGMGAANNEGIYIRDNVFYLSRYAMITLLDYLAVDGTTSVNAQPVFSGNTYVQFFSKPLLQKNWSSEIYYPSEDVVRDILKDETGSLVIIG